MRIQNKRVFCLFKAAVKERGQDFLFDCCFLRNILRIVTSFHDADLKKTEHTFEKGLEKTVCLCYNKAKRTCVRGEKC